MTRLLVLGGSGYLGQFLVHRLQSAQQYQTFATYSSHPLPETLIAASRAVKINLLDDQNVKDVLDLVQPDIVVNCAAISDIAKNAKEPQTSEKINVSAHVVNWIAQRIHAGHKALYVFISTDQVFDGKGAPYRETSAVNPPTHYGATKLAAERLIREKLPGHHVVRPDCRVALTAQILRSTVIIGPAATLCPGAHHSVLQFLEDQLRAGKRTDCFVDEFRTFVYVEDLVSVILSAVQKLAEGSLGGHTVFNVGGPDRLSRHELALLVASVCKLDAGCIVAKEQAKATLEYPRPPDLTLDNSLVRSVLGVQGTPLRAVVERACGGPRGAN